MNIKSINNGNVYNAWKGIIFILRHVLLFGSTFCERAYSIFSSTSLTQSSDFSICCTITSITTQEHWNTNRPLCCIQSRIAPVNSTSHWIWWYSAMQKDQNTIETTARRVNSNRRKAKVTTWLPRGIQYEWAIHIPDAFCWNSQFSDCCPPRWVLRKLGILQTKCTVHWVLGQGMEHKVENVYQNTHNNNTKLSPFTSIPFGCIS